MPNFFRALKASFRRFRTSKSPTCDSVASFCAVSGHPCTFDDATLVVTPSEAILPPLVELGASLDCEASHDESSVSEYNSSSGSDATSALSSVTSHDLFEEPEEAFTCVSVPACESRVDACITTTSKIDASLTDCCAIDDNLHGYEEQAVDFAENDTPNKDGIETLEREEANTKPCATRLQQNAPLEIETCLPADALQSGQLAIISPPQHPDDHMGSTTELAVTEIAPAMPTYSEVAPSVQAAATTVSPSPSFDVDSFPSATFVGSPSFSDMLASADSSLFPPLMNSTRSEEDMKMLLASISTSPSDDYISLMATTRSEQDMRMLLASIPMSPSDDYISLMATTRSEEDMKVLLTSISTSPSDDYISLMATTRSEQDMRVLLASIPISPSDEYILGPSDNKVLSASRVVLDSYTPGVDALRAFGLHGSPSLITSKPMEEIEEEITRILAPFSRMGLSTGFEPLDL